MALISGVRGTGNTLANKHVIDMSEQISMLNPSEAPLTLLTKGKGGASKKSCFNPKFSWMEDDLQARWDAANGAVAAVSENIIVDNYTYFTAGDIIKVPRTGECMKCLTASSATITATRGFGETAAAIINDNDTLVIIGNANEEGATMPTMKSNNEAEVYNYTQIFRTPFGVTATENASKEYGGKDLSVQRKKKGIEHAVDIERAFLFGERKLLTSGTHYLRTTRGLLKFISTNVTNIGGLMSKQQLDTFCQGVFQYGSNKRLLLCSPTLLTAISQLGAGMLNIVPSDKVFGLSIKEYLTPHGTLYLAKHKLLESTYDGYGIAVDVDNLKYRFLEGRDTKLNTNVQANDEDGERDEYITECGLECRQEQTHGILKGVTGAV